MRDKRQSNNNKKKRQKRKGGGGGGGIKQTKKKRKKKGGGGGGKKKSFDDVYAFCATKRVETPTFFVVLFTCEREKERQRQHVFGLVDPCHTLSRTRPHLHIPKKNELYYLRRTKRLVARVSIDVVFKDERRKAPNEIHVASMRRVR